MVRLGQVAATAAAGWLPGSEEAQSPSGRTSGPEGPGLAVLRMPALHRQVIALAQPERLFVSVAAAGRAQYQLGGEDFGLGFPAWLRLQEGLQACLRQFL